MSRRFLTAKHRQCVKTGSHLLGKQHLRLRSEDRGRAEAVKCRLDVGWSETKLLQSLASLQIIKVEGNMFYGGFG
jgi:hypothetical protein